jgi:hypothetical protein
VPANKDIAMSHNNSTEKRTLLVFAKLPFGTAGFFVDMLQFAKTERFVVEFCENCAIITMYGTVPYFS